MISCEHEQVRPVRLELASLEADALSVSYGRVLLIMASDNNSRGRSPYRQPSRFQHALNTITSSTSVRPASRAASSAFWGETSRPPRSLRGRASGAAYNRVLFDSSPGRQRFELVVRRFSRAIGMPAHRIFGRRGVGNAPTPDTWRGKGGSLAAISFTARQTWCNSRSSTSPRKCSVTCMLSGSTHFTSAPVLASAS